MLSPQILLVVTGVVAFALPVASGLKKDNCIEKDEDASIPLNYKTCHRYEKLNETIRPKTEDLPESSKCDPGYYEQCLPCPLGYFKKNRKNTPCYLCGSGSGTPDAGAKWCTKLCKAGTRLQEDGKKRTRICKPCEKGYYQPYSNIDYNCVPCPHNMTTAKTGSKSANDCFLNCLPGQHSISESTACVLCPEGTYKTDFGPQTCTICPKNKTTAEDGAVDSTLCIKPCEPGRQYNKTSGNCDIKCGRGTFKGEFSSRTKCRPCPPNFAPNRRKAATTCIPNCGPGYEINGNQDNCTACEFGFFKTETGNFPCQSCPGSQMTLAKAARNSGECQDFHRCAKPLSQKLDLLFNELQGIFVESDSFIDAMVNTCRLGPTDNLTELLEEVVRTFQTCGVLGQINLSDVDIDGKTYRKEHYLEIFRTAYGYGGMCNFVHCLNNAAPEIRLSKTLIREYKACPFADSHCFCSDAYRAVATSYYHHLQLCPALQFHPEFLEVNFGGTEMIDSLLTAPDVPTFCASTNNCDGVDCGNGVCSSLPSGGYKCRCRFGYTGDHCQSAQYPLEETEPGVPTSTIVPTLHDRTEQPHCPTCEQCQECPTTEPCPQCPIPSCPECPVTSCPTPACPDCPTNKPCQECPITLCSTSEPCPQCPRLTCPDCATSEPCPECPVTLCPTKESCPIPSCPECPITPCPTSEPCSTTEPCPQCPTPVNPTIEPCQECPILACPTSEPCPDCPRPTDPPTCPTSSTCPECPKPLAPSTCQPCLPCPECTTLPSTTSEPCPVCPQISEPEPCPTTSAPLSCPACPEPPTPPVCPTSTPCPDCPTSSESHVIPTSTACPVCPEHPSTPSNTCVPCPECPTIQEPIPCPTSAPCPDCPKLACPACPTCPITTEPPPCPTCPTTTEPPPCPTCAACPTCPTTTEPPPCPSCAACPTCPTTTEPPPCPTCAACPTCPPTTEPPPCPTCAACPAPTPCPTAAENQRSCLELLKAGKTQSGVYEIYVPSLDEQIEVYCDQETDGGGWIVFQRRQDGSMDFYRDWNTYKVGFGQLTKEFWLGLDIIHELTTPTNQDLRIDFQSFDFEERFAEYSAIEIGTESNYYNLTVANYKGNAGDSFTGHSGHLFSTKDADHDTSSSSCAQTYKGGWWYSACHSSNLNGLYLNGAHESYADGIEWWAWRGHYYSLKYTEMKVREWHDWDGTRKPESCLEWLKQGHTRSGTYQIYVTSMRRNVEVYCDQDTDGGGWIVFQRRKDGSIDFYRGWNSYQFGFGQLKGELWLGLDILHHFTTSKSCSLRIDFHSFDYEERLAKYSTFAIGPESENYALTLADYTGNAGDSLTSHNGHPFSTKDADHDSSDSSCSELYNGAWWYNSCHSSNLNGLYLKGDHESYADGVDWYAWRGHHYSLKFTEMKVREITNWTGTRNPTSCLEWLKQGHTQSGIYHIYVAGMDREVKVYCDQDTEGGGWIVFQRRQDGSIDFYRGWNSYQFGFGKAEGESWLGLESLHHLTNAQRCELRLDFHSFDYEERLAKYSTFAIGPESENYALTLSDYTGNAGDSLTSHNGHPFSTKDADHDSSDSSCADLYKGAWWYNSCHSSNLNGRYLKGDHESYADGVDWYAWRGHHYSLKFTEMKFREWTDTIGTRNPASCLEWLKQGHDISGVYKIYVAGLGRDVEVYCDQVTDGGGWIVFQRRQDGSIDFYRGWNSYQFGFGQRKGEFWLGLENLHHLTHVDNYELRIDLQDTTGEKRYAQYNNFGVGADSTNYVLTVDDFTGDAGDSLTGHNGHPFSTKDADHDSSDSSCAELYKGGWWYSSCHSSNLNGLYLNGQHDSYADGVNWYAWKGHHYSLKFTEMKLREKVEN